MRPPLIFNKKAVSRCLRHTDVTITLRVYSHLMPDDDEKLAIKTTDLFGEGCTASFRSIAENEEGHNHLRLWPLCAVRVTGLEPVTPTMSMWYSSQLS